MQTNDAIRQAMDMGTSRKVKLTIVTGRGLHSSGSAKIQPVIKRLLESRGLGFKEHVGSFVLEYAPFTV